MAQNLLLKEALRDFNPWWYGRFEKKFKEREICKKLDKFMPLRQIIAFTGLRRVGKTTLMLKIAQETMKKGKDAKNVIYFSFDEFKDARLKEIIGTYQEMMESNFEKEKYLLMLDEIQKLDDWENQLKAVYDLHENIKIIISGSESLFIKRKSKETLAGRIFEFKIEPLSFKEFLAFKEIDFKPIGIYEKELRKLFDEFILTLGFPELIGIKEKEIIKKYIKESIIEKVVYRDIAQLFKIKDISVLESLLNVLTEEPGQIIELSKLANELNISRQTLSEYLKYLEESFLLRKLYNFSKSKRKTERKLKKYYPTIISADLLFREDEHSKSKVFEWLIVNQLNAEFFWRDPYKNEVDVVLADKDPTPIEIKYGTIDFDGLLAFMKKFKINRGYILSSGLEKEQKINAKIISVVPAFKFLLEK